MSFNISELFPTAYYIFLKSPWVYKIGLGLTILLIGSLAFYGHKMYKESLKYHDFFASNIRIFVEEQFNERTISFNIESLSETPVYLNQVQVVIYDNQKTETALQSVIKLGRVNPLKKGDIVPFTCILDNNPKMGDNFNFNFTNVIKEHEYMMQVYKVILVVHYSDNTLGNNKNQRFEYLYNVFRDNGAINGQIREVPNMSKASEQINYNVPYEIK